MIIKNVILTSLSLSVFLLSTLPMPSYAGEVDEEVRQIFDRRQRQLASPPKSLRSKGSASDQSRFQEGLDRVQKRMNADAEEETAGAESPQPESVQPKSGTQDPAAKSQAAASDAAPKGAPVADTTRVTTPLMPSAASSGESRKGKIIVIRESRREKRQGVLDSYSFDGTRAVGIGLVGGGPYGIFGAEVDLGFGSKWSGGFGIGTGMAYATWGIYARKYFLEGPLSTFLQAGYANWNINSIPYREKALYPEYLANLFFDRNATGSYNSRKSVHLVYPSTGVLYQTKSGLAYTAALQYFINTKNFTGALFAGLGMHFYF